MSPQKTHHSFAFSPSRLKQFVAHHQNTQLTPVQISGGGAEFPNNLLYTAKRANATDTTPQKTHKQTPATYEILKNNHYGTGIVDSNGHRRVAQRTKLPPESPRHQRRFMSPT